MVIMRTYTKSFEMPRTLQLFVYKTLHLSFSHHDVSNNEKKIDPSMKIKVLDHPKNFGLLVVVVVIKQQVS